MGVVHRVSPSHRRAASLHLYADAFDFAPRIYANRLIHPSGTHSAVPGLIAHRFALCKRIGRPPHMLNIALVSEHASPMAVAGGIDSGGQNIYVAQVATQLARLGCHVDVFTRRDSSELPETFNWMPNVRVKHVRAGPCVKLPKEQLLPHMDEFADRMTTMLMNKRQPCDLIHANFFMSAWASLRPARMLNIPLVTTFHALGMVRRAHQRDADAFPDRRFDLEREAIEGSDSIIAECAQDRIDLITLYNAEPERIHVVPCGFDPAEMTPMDQADARKLLGWPDHFTVLQLGRLVPRKGIDNVIRAIA